MQRPPITIKGLHKLQDELKHLKSEERPLIIRAIADARALGDLSENAEYHAAKDKQGFIEGRIAELEGIIGQLEVIDPTQLTGPEIKFGATVTLFDEQGEREVTYQIVGEMESDAGQGLLSIRAPLSRALIGKRVGDVVEVSAPGGERGYEIINIKYI